MLAHRLLMCKYRVPQHWTVASSHLLVNSNCFVFFFFPNLNLLKLGWYTIFIYSLMLQTLLRDRYLSETLDEESFYLNSDVESFVMDWIFFDIVYIPMHVYNDHCVECEDHLGLQEIRAYDLAPDAHFDAELCTALRPLYCLFPHLLHYMGFYDHRPDVDDNLDPFMYSRLIEGIPCQAPNLDDCGILTCMFIQYLGLGIPLNFRPEDRPTLRAKVVVNLWVDQLL